MKILVIDDNKPDRQEWFADVFAAHYPDWELHQAYNYEEAMRAFSEHQYDLAFFDHDLSWGPDGSKIAFDLLNNPEQFKAPKAVWIHTNSPEGAKNIAAKFRSGQIPYCKEMFGMDLFRTLKNRDEFEAIITELHRQAE